LKKYQNYKFGIHKSFRAKLTGIVEKGKVFNNIDPEYKSIAIVGLGCEGAGFNELEILDEGMVK